MILNSLYPKKTQKKKPTCFTLDVSAPSESQRVDACGGAETEVSIDEIIPV